jgi:hypothetical protein
VNSVFGHQIRYDWEQEAWMYVSDGQPIEGNLRACTVCHQAPDEDGHDPCIRSLPDVVNACCGHGNQDRAYVVFTDDLRMRGQAAVAYFNSVKTTVL